MAHRTETPGVKLVRQASNEYRRAVNRAERARRVLRKAESDARDKSRALKLAIDAVQPILTDLGVMVHELDGAAGVQPELFDPSR